MENDKRINILFVFHDANYLSGATHSLIDIIDSLIKTNSYCMFAVLPISIGSLISELKNRNIVIITSSYGGMQYTNGPIFRERATDWFRCFVKCGISWLNTRFSLTNKVRKYAIDVIYTNTSTVYVGAWLNKYLKIKHVWHFREFGLEDQNTIKFYGNKRFGKFVEKHTDRVIVISKALEQNYSQFINKRLISLVYNDLSPEMANYQQKAIDNKPLNLLISGTISDGKGQKHVIEAVNILKKNGVNVKLHIAGKSIGNSSNQLKEMAAEYGIQNVVHFLGFVSDMKSLRDQMDIGIVPSKSEAFGRITIEGMLSGMAMIGANCGANPELISDNETGMLYEWGNAMDLASKISFLESNRDVVNELGKRGYNFALEFTKGNGARKVDMFIKDLL